MDDDILELGDGEPFVTFKSLTLEKYLPETEAEETNLWTLALIILAIWLGVRNL